MANEHELSRMLGQCGHFAARRDMSAHGQGMVLQLLNASSQLTQQELLDKLKIQPGSLSETLSKLERHQLIARIRDTGDKRCVRIALTEKGKDAATQMAAMEAQGIFNALDEVECNELKRILCKLNADWETRFGKEQVYRRPGHCHRRPNEKSSGISSEESLEESSIEKNFGGGV